MRKASLQEISETYLNLKPAGDMHKTSKTPSCTDSYRLPVLAKHPISKQSSAQSLNTVLYQSTPNIRDPHPRTNKARSQQKFASFDEEVAHIARSTLYTRAININYNHLMKNTFDKRIDLRPTAIKFNEIYEKEAKRNGSSLEFQEKIDQLFKDDPTDQLQSLLSEFDKYKVRFCFVDQCVFFIFVRRRKKRKDLEHSKVILFSRVNEKWKSKKK